MEELQSTEILDREILEDARKKAYRILKTADETVTANATAWEEKTRSALDELAKKYAQQRESAAAEIMARLPMDKRRAKAETIEALLHSAVKAWYAGLGRERALAILQNELSRRLGECEEFSPNSGAPRVWFHNLDRAEAETMARAVLPGRSCAFAELSSLDPYPLIMLENDTVRITASINKTADFFLHEKRAELVSALLGENAIAGEDAL